MESYINIVNILRLSAGLSSLILWIGASASTSDNMVVRETNKHSATFGCCRISSMEKMEQELKGGLWKVGKSIMPQSQSLTPEKESRDYGRTLVRVDCSNCGITSLPVSLPVSEDRVGEYILSGNSISNIPGNAFKNFTNLAQLNLGYNPVKNISSDAFNGLDSLKNLQINFGCTVGNKLIDISTPENFLSPMPKLQFLHIDDTCFRIKKLVQSLCNVSSALDTLLLPRVYRRFLTSSAWVVEKQLGLCLKHTTLRKLSLERNLIVVIKQGTFTNFPHLEWLSLRDNFIVGDGASLVDAGLFMFKLRYLDIGQQFSPHIAINRRRRSSYSESLVTSGKAKTLLQQQLDISKQIHSHGADIQYFFNSLREIRMDHCWTHSQKVQLESLQVCLGSNKVRWIDISYSPITYIMGEIPCIAGLLYVNMRGIKSQYLHPDIFRGASSLQTLLLAESSHPSTYESANSTRLFHHTRNLEYLELANNAVRKLPVDMFIYLQNLTILDLSKNKIRDTTFSLLNLTSLRNLSLAYNDIKYFNSSFVAQLQYISQQQKNQSIFLDLRGNPLICNCYYFNKYLWSLQESNIRVSRESSCSFGDGTEVMLHEAIRNLSAVCRVLSTTETVAMVLYCLTLVAVVFACLAYRYRWKLQYALLLARSLLRHHRSAEHQPFLHDCFVSYNNKDAWWLHEELIPRLGKRKEAATLSCDDDRITHGRRFDFYIDDDFLAGTGIIENIVDAILKSKCTLLFITRKFVQSNWCKFEADLAHTHYLSERRRRIIAVVHERVVPLRGTKLPVGLDALLDTVTYLEWPLDEERRPAFWLRLEQALSE